MDDRYDDGVLAPPVVVVVVVHDPGEWFDETLQSLARQDYPNLNTLFLLAGTSSNPEASPDVLGARIRAHLPDAFVRVLEGGSSTGPGYGPAADVVLDVVEGDSGFFCLCHDDVALAPDAVRVMVGELYRSNAGIVGPKLVVWENPQLLLDVGLDVDRFGVPAPRVEPGEFDQQQHDAATEVFAVPSACLLVRADLFRALGGFDPAIRYHGEDVDLCWRARITGARVVVAPGARVRHRGELPLRRPDINHAVLRARNELRSTLTLTAGARLPVRIAELVGLALVELVAGLFTGRLGEAWASLRALVAAVPRAPSYLARRGSIAKLRRPAVERERHGDDAVTALQSRGSNRLRSFGRVREMRTLIGVEQNIRRWRERSLLPLLVWAAVVIAVLVASRTFINQSVPVIGEMLPFPADAGELWDAFVSGWNATGLGATSANPTGLGALAVGSVAWLFDMSVAPVVLVIGLVLLGCLGVWRLTDLFPVNRERIVALVVYAAVPLLPGVISTGRLGVLVAYAAVPWFVHLLRGAVGIGTADPASAAADLADGVIALAWRERVRRSAVAAIAMGVAVGMAPPILPVVAAVALVLGVTTLLAGAGWRTAGAMTVTGAAVAAAAWVLNLPAASTWSWDDLTAVPLAGPEGRGLGGVAAMDIGEAALSHLTIALYVPVLAGLVLARAWRLTWAARAAGLVLSFGALAVLHDRDALPVRVPEIGYLLVPVALGLALAAACAVAAFSADVAGGIFGWRQPLGIASVGAVAVGMFPSLLTLTDGSWYAPSTTLATLVQPQIAPEPDAGDFRVLYLGDPRLLPGAVVDLGEDGGFAPGVALALTGPGLPTIVERWAPARTSADDTLRAVLGDIAGTATQRGGRLLAPFAIRYIVVPIYDGAVSTPDHPVPPPTGLLGALSSQLDLELLHSPPNFVVFENRSFYPGTSLFTGGAAAGAAAEGPDQLVQADLTSGRPALGRVLDDRRGSGTVEPGVVHLAVPFDEHWELTVGDDDVAPRPGLGPMTAFDVPSTGTAELAYEQPSARRRDLLGQAAAWAAALLVASRIRLPRWFGRMTSGPRTASPMIDLDDLGGEPSLAPAALGPLDAARSTARPFDADDESSRSAWVEEMFAGEDDAGVVDERWRT